ncbi:hypothetical protein [Maricaulis sp.]|uniref:hypothetical protein n=1 Tax=Maricaulis sp. TaxID=1486257 RepID=UPI00262B526B|nr:hypothetical protein [Maricaulis sp.]
MTDRTKEMTTFEGNDDSSVPANQIDLGTSQVVDLTGLSEDQASELRRQYASGMIDIHRKAQELKVDVGALEAGLSTFNDQATRASEAGHSATITHTQTTAAGRTEVVIGNTERAASGKISRSAAGQADITVWLAAIGAGAAIVIALIAFN